ncbi:NADPH:quinone reductase [Pseudophaeobacter flagellatus]|uniref:NADPH:quinone reductase n=1 Tax=Pseudophaeobacter flagellatus TaxID=2899119 RepID=UPI001E32B2C1|nr:NADPH:quinone reductase [Pseudophaeobacter flagellatus]MCD9150075.1 NADPH:quinone reductase [Pseudophaeobacter flagellatus]
MKAITYRAFGPAAEVLQLEELPAPSPDHGEVLVEVSFTGVNPSDVKTRTRGQPGLTGFPWDYIIPHSDGSGVISAVGEGVPSSRIGERVWIWNGQFRRACGTAAQQITLPAAQAVPLPDEVSLETGAVLGIPGLTACHAVFGQGEVSGKTVLVQGGAGTVGILAVQLAKWGGARVIATCGAQGSDRARRAGADTVLDYRAEDLADQVLTANGGNPVDLIVEVEFGSNIDTDAQVIAENGRIAAYGSAREMSPKLPFMPLLFKAVTVEIILVYLLSTAERDRAIRRLNDALEAQVLKFDIQKVYNISEACAAHQAVEAGAREGAVLIRLNGS